MCRCHWSRCASAIGQLGANSALQQGYDRQLFQFPRLKYNALIKRHWKRMKKKMPLKPKSTDTSHHLWMCWSIFLSLQVTPERGPRHLSGDHSRSLWVSLYGRRNVAWTGRSRFQVLTRWYLVPGHSCGERHSGFQSNGSRDSRTLSFPRPHAAHRRFMVIDLDLAHT